MQSSWPLFRITRGKGANQCSKSVDVKEQASVQNYWMQRSRPNYISYKTRERWEDRHAYSVNSARRQYG
jgi:hypothetical protein